MIASSKRLQNLGEILSPTVQPAKLRGAGGDDEDQPPSMGQRGGRPPARGRGGGRGWGRNSGNPSSRKDSPGPPGDSSQGARRKEPNGTYHCPYQISSGKCDVCSHMVERREVQSSHFGRKHAIAGRNIHLPSTRKIKLRWFVYLEECVHPTGVYQYVGSTNSMTQRWSNTKSIINSMQSRDNVQPGTGLENHFKMGCSQYSGPELSNVKISLLEHMDTTEEKLHKSSHKSGPGCRCNQCEILKNLEDKWITRLGSYHGHHGLNERDEIIRKARISY